jgi:alkylation response protein AidB-like acyl-CoA dehydrogenase
VKLEISDDHRATVEALHDFLEKECPEEYTRRIDNAHEFPEEAWRKMADLGYLGWPIPEKYGGQGGDLLGTALIVEELCRGCFALGNAYVNSTYAASYAFGIYGSEAMKDEFLPALCRGEVRFAFAFTEPGGGQDVLGAMATRAAKQEDGSFVINGQKVFNTHANVSDYLVVLARSSTGEKRSQGLSMFLVDSDAPGVEVNVLDTIVFAANATCETFFQDVSVSADRVIGEVDQGWRQITKTLDVEKVVVAAEAVGNAQAALDYALTYSEERSAFGGPIGRFQSLQHYIAEAAVKIESARILVRNTAAMYDAGEPIGYQALLCKVAASEAGVFTTDVGMRILGGYGYMREYPMQRYFRDSRVFLTGPITNEMALNQIAEKLGMPRSY